MPPPPRLHPNLVFPTTQHRLARALLSLVAPRTGDAHLLARLRALLLQLLRAALSSATKVQHLLALPTLISRLAWIVVLEIAYKYLGHVVWTLRPLLMRHGLEVLRWRRDMRDATGYEAWKRAAMHLDILEGKEEWKRKAESRMYDSKRLQARIDLYSQLMEDKDIDGLVFHLRAELFRRQFGLGNPNMFSRTYHGTKHVIERYVETVCRSLRMIQNAHPGLISPAQKLIFFNETRHSFGRTALMLSGGAALGLYHIGVIKALHEAELLPNVISGSSAGSIVAGILGATPDDELEEKMFNPDVVSSLIFFGSGERTDIFSDVRALLGRIPEALFSKTAPREKRTLLDIEILRDSIRGLIGDITFVEAYDRTGRIINITVSPSNRAGSDYPRLLNYLTAPNVVVWSACIASSSIPGVFESVELIARDISGNLVPYDPEGFRWADGSLEMDLPTARLSELFNVNHFIVSQVNPHAKLFMGETASTAAGRFIRFLRRQVRQHIIDLSDAGWGLSNALTSFVSIISQTYEGDVTIAPDLSLQDFRTLLENPDHDRAKHCVLEGQRLTWPKLSAISNQCKVEFELNLCVRKMRRLFLAQSGGAELGRVPSFHTSRSTIRLNKLTKSTSLPRGTSRSDTQLTTLSTLAEVATPRSIEANDVTPRSITVTPPAEDEEELGEDERPIDLAASNGNGDAGEDEDDDVDDTSSEELDVYKDRNSESHDPKSRTGGSVTIAEMVAWGEIDAAVS